MKSRKRRKTYYPAPGGVTATDSRKVSLIKNLNELLLKKGWKQSDLAREAQHHMPKGKEFGRHLPSAYLTGKNMPSPMMLDAMAKAFGVQITDIVSESTAEFVGMEPTTVRVEMRPSGRARVFIDMEMDTEKAFKIMNIIQG